tara:strand:+ start:148 stop:372 length:225 start_codon:yes stop_codon:yes gene_type:complete
MAKILVSLGVFLCFFGLLGLAIVIYSSLKIRKHTKHHEKDKQKATFEQLLIINYLAISVSAFGFIIIIFSIFLS